MSTTPHKATAEQWAFLRQWGADGGPTATALLELRARVEALEAAANHPAKPDSSPAPASSLVERVADAIVTKATSAGIVDDRPARAAIREVVTWLRDRGGYPWAWVAQMLELEVSNG